MTDALEPYRVAERDLWRWAGASPTERFVELPSGRVRVQELGAGPPALFLHGVMTAGSVFAPLVAKLPELRCLVLDRPGCGLSAPWQLAPEFRDQAVEAVRQVLDALAIDSIALVGSSLGGLWATWFALAYPRRVRKLVVIGPSIGFPGVHAPAFMRIAALPGVGALIKRKMRLSRAGLERVFAQMGHRRSLDAGKIPEEMFAWGVRLDDTGTPRHDIDAMLRAVGVRGARRWIQLGDETLRRLEVPTLLVAGTNDTHGGPALASRAAERIPGCKVETLAGAGHIPWFDDAPAVADLVRGFAS